MAPGEQIGVLPKPGLPRERAFMTQPGVGHIRRIGVHNNTLVNIMRALRERVFAVEGPDGLQPPPAPVAGAFDRLRDFRSQLLNKIGPCHPITLREFLGKYKGAKLTMYTKAVEDLETLGIERKHAFLKAFIKGEFVDLDTKADPAPRLIQPRDPKYNAALGRFIQPLERRVYRAIKRMFGDHTVMKGFNAEDVGKIAARKWAKFLDPACVGLDASRFDQHVSVAALKWEHSVYMALCPDEDKQELAELLSWQISNVGHAYLNEASVTYTVEGRRMSGDMNTALGNCLLMCALVWTYARKVGVPIELMNNGDDCQVIMEKENLPKFVAGLQAWFVEMGFTMKVEPPRYVLEQMEFCQAKPVCVDGSWIMCRNPFVCISKDVTWKAPDSGSPVKVYNEWAHGVGGCGLSLCSGMPVLQAFYEYLQRGSPIPKRTRFDTAKHGGALTYMSGGLCRTRSPVSASTRYSFWMAWGITPDSQEEKERYYEGLEPCTSVRQMIGDQPIASVVPYQVYETS